MKKRLFAGLLSLLMLWTMLPVSALAVEGEGIETYPAYFYVLKPERVANWQETSTDNFYYVGTGKIYDAEAPGGNNAKSRIYFKR